jgi:uncharacterized protein YjbI with pentapeptide repeats
MADLNPYRRGARLFAFLCYLFAGFIMVVGVFFTLGAATADLSKLPMPPGTTNRGMAVLQACTFLTIAVMAVAVGWRIQALLGRRFLGDKLVARSAVGCLTTGSVGCGLWALLSACSMLVIGRMVIENQQVGVVPSNFGEVVIGASGFILAICVMLAVAWFISANFTELSPEERRLAYQGYLNDVQPRLHKMGEAAVQSFVEGRTLEVLTKLNPPLKRTLLEFLGEHDLLTGISRVRLNGADFRRVDLRSIRLPRADLSEVDLTRAVLAESALFGASLQNARLRGVDLTSANLQDANLRQADLTDAVLDKTILSGSNLTGARVSSLQLDQARLKQTIRPDGRVSD